MSLKKRGEHSYGDSQADIREELLRYSHANAYVTDYFADAVCKCGGKLFRLSLDDTEGAAVRKCNGCGIEHPIGDSDEYLEEAELGECACPCPKCGLTAVYGDWKNEFNGYRELLGRV
jgi:hypothetical protein